MENLLLFGAINEAFVLEENGGLVWSHFGFEQSEYYVVG